HQRGEFAFGWRRDIGNCGGRHRLSRRADALHTQRRHVARRETAPPDEHRRQGLHDLAGPQTQQPMPAAQGERLAKPRRDGLVHAGRIVGRFADEMAVWCHTQAEAGGACGHRSRSADATHAWLKTCGTVELPRSPPAFRSTWYRTGSAAPTPPPTGGRSGLWHTTFGARCAALTGLPWRRGWWCRALPVARSCAWWPGSGVLCGP